jgi:hypothetical protein
MPITREGRFERADIWREGKWLDLWSVVHLFSGISVGFVLYFLHFGAPASVILALLSFILYEMWEVIVRIEEAPTNRFMDVVVGMVSFLPTFFLLAPRLSGTLLIFMFGIVLTANVVVSVFGWIASQKAAALEERVRARYLLRRERRLEKKKRLLEEIHG